MDLITSKSEHLNFIKPIFGENQFERIVGQGAYGTIYKIKDIDYCIKKQKHTVKSDMEFLIMKTIKHHPNIVEFYDYYYVDSFSHMVLEFIDGSTLDKTQIKNYKIVFLQILEGIQFVHNKNVVHRDLKPQNIMMRNNGIVKIIDFSLGCVFDPKGKIMSYCGTLKYMAPEVIKQIPYVGPEIDVWSLGIVFYFLITDSYPFDGSEIQIVNNTLFENPSYDKINDPALMNLIQAMLEKKSSNRIFLREILSHVYFDGDYIHNHSKINTIYSSRTRKQRLSVIYE